MDAYDIRNRYRCGWKPHLQGRDSEIAPIRGRARRDLEIAPTNPLDALLRKSYKFLLQIGDLIPQRGGVLKLQIGGRLLHPRS